MQLSDGTLMTSLVLPRPASPARDEPSRSKPPQLSQAEAATQFYRRTAALPLATVYRNLRNAGYDHKGAWAGVMDTLHLREVYIDRPRRVREAVEARRRG